MRRNALVLAAAALCTPIAVFAAPRTFSDLANQIVVLIDSAIVVLVVAALVWYMWSIASSIQQGKDKGSDKLKAYATWGVVILFVMVSVWGIIQILQNSLFGSSGASVGGDSGGFDSPNFFPADFGS